MYIPCYLNSMLININLLINSAMLTNIFALLI